MASERTNIAKAAGKVSGATLISRVLGFARDMAFAYFFGATGVSDTFVIGYRIPNLLRELFAEGSMSAAVVPVLTEYHEKKGIDEAGRLVRVLFTFMLVAVGCLTVLGIAFTPYIVRVMAPGFAGFPDKFDMTVRLTRIMFPFLLFISLSTLAMGALNTRRVFFVPALAPATFNIMVISTMIAMAFALPDVNPAVSASIGVLAGGFMQFAVQAPAFLREGYRFGLDADFRHPGLMNILKLVFPMTGGVAVNQVNILISSLLASFLAGGSVTYLFYSIHLIQFPIGVFGVAMSTAVLPSLSAHAIRGDVRRLREDFSFALRLLFFLSVPAMAGLIALRGPIVNLLYQRGAFDYEATLGTSGALLYYSLGIWSMVGVRVVAAAFYSMKETKTPVVVASMALVTNILLSVFLMDKMEHRGLALANSVASMFNFSVMFVLLRKRLRRVGARSVSVALLKTAAASILMGLLGWALLRGEMWTVAGRGLLKAGYMAGTIVLCAGAYAFLMYLFGSEELRFILGFLKEKFGRPRGNSD